jgi:hypothetical protein
MRSAPPAFTIAESKQPGPYLPCTAGHIDQGHCIYFSEAEICQNIEEFLTTKAHKGAQRRRRKE